MPTVLEQIGGQAFILGPKHRPLFFEPIEV
jgi:hypothetical protein